MVLALIVERVSGMPFADFLEKNIFAPLGMEHSFVYSKLQNTDSLNEKLQGYRRRRVFFPLPETQHDGAVGDKGVYSTAADLYKWDQALYTDQLVSKESLQKAFSPGTLKNGQEIPYGFGFRIRKNIEKDWVVYHNGLWNGFRTGITRYLDDRHTIIILEHTNCKGKDIILKKIERVIQSPHQDYTRVLAGKAIYEGPEKAIEIYETIEEMGLDVQANLKDLMKVHQYLLRVDKPQTAKNLKMFIEKIE